MRRNGREREMAWGVLDAHPASRPQKSLLIMKIKTSLLVASSALTFMCCSAHGALLIENFGYSDGAIVGASGSPWVNNTGTAGQSDVTSGALNIVSTETEDIAAPLSETVTAGVITATFDVNFSVVPTVGGAYFAHFIAATNQFEGRVWAARPTGTATGAFRLGVANSSNTANFITVDLATATTYTLTLSLDLATDIATLVVNNGVTLLGSASGTDAVFNGDINRFGFRQATGEGTLRVDNLAVVPEPEASALLGVVGILGILRRRR